MLSQERNSASVVPVVLAVLGSVCGTVITAALGASPTLRLVGAAVGAAVPPVVTTAGPYWRLRVASGVAVAATALFVTYGGFTLTDYATDKAESTFPLGVLPATSAEASSGDNADDTEPVETSQTPEPTDIEQCEGELCIHVTPASITCTSVDCATEVTITNTGTVELQVNGIEFEPDDVATYERTNECEYLLLQPGSSCSMIVTAAGAELAPTKLVIHQNLLGPATRVPIAIDGATTPPPTSEVDLGLTDSPWCSVEPYSAADGGDVLTVRTDITSEGADEAVEVEYVVTSSNGSSTTGTTLVSPGMTPFAADVTLSEFDYVPGFEVTVTIDPYDAVVESDEGNNTRVIAVDLPGRPAAYQEMSCAAH